MLITCSEPYLSQAENEETEAQSTGGCEVKNSQDETKIASEETPRRVEAGPCRKLAQQEEIQHPQVLTITPTGFRMLEPLGDFYTISASLVLLQLHHSFSNYGRGLPGPEPGHRQQI